MNYVTALCRELVAEPAQTYTSWLLTQVCCSQLILINQVRHLMVIVLSVLAKSFTARWFWLLESKTQSTSSSSILIFPPNGFLNTGQTQKPVFAGRAGFL